jgi:arsenate reductase-like glutaredoxin family protein
MDELQVISQSDIESFFRTPNFQIGINFQVSDEDMTDDWSSCTNDIGILISSLRARDIIYQQCRKRYILLRGNRKELLTRESLRGPLYSVLSEALFWLGDLHGSANYLNELKNLLTEPSVKLSRIIQIVSALCKSQENEEMNAELETFDMESQVPVFHICKLSPCGSMNIVQDDLNQVLEEWAMCKSEIGELLATEIFSRYACVTTDELENVFEVEESTWHRLVRKGFMENSIAGISENSKIKSKSRIVRILKNTNKCVNEIGRTLSSNYESYDEEFICTLHAELMAKILRQTEVDESGITQCIMVIPAGVTSQHFMTWF